MLSDRPPLSFPHHCQLLTNLQKISSEQPNGALLSPIHFLCRGQIIDSYTLRCPDGSTVLAQSENRTFHFLELFVISAISCPSSCSCIPLRPSEHFSSFPPTPLTSNSLSKLSFVRPLPQPSPILDFIWYPFATIRDSASFCFVASVRDTPVRLLDARDGRVSTLAEAGYHFQQLIGING